LTRSSLMLVAATLLNEHGGEIIPEALADKPKIELV